MTEQSTSNSERDLKDQFRHAYMLATVKDGDAYVVFDPGAVEHANLARQECVALGESTDSELQYLEYAGFSMKGTCPMFRVKRDSRAFSYLEVLAQEGVLVDGTNCDAQTHLKDWGGIAKDHLRTVEYCKRHALLVASEEDKPYAYVVFGHKGVPDTLDAAPYLHAMDLAKQARKRGLYDAPEFGNEENPLIDELDVNYRNFGVHSCYGFYIDKQSPEYRMLQTLQHQGIIATSEHMDRLDAQVAVKDFLDADRKQRAHSMGVAFEKALLVIDKEGSDSVQVVFAKESGREAIVARNTAQLKTTDEDPVFDESPCETIRVDPNAYIVPEKEKKPVEYYPMIEVKKGTAAHQYLVDRQTSLSRHLQHCPLAENENIHEAASAIVQAQARFQLSIDTQMN